MKFADAVLSTPEIAECLKAGLQALGANSSKVIVETTRDVAGSVDIDNCLKRQYPNAPRWDYVFGYKDKIYYVEVHQGKTSEMKNIIRKVKWLRQWLKTSAESLEVLRDQSTYHWISTSRTTLIRKGSRHRRDLDQNGIRGPSSVLIVDSVS